MGYTTTADERLESAREHIKEATKDLSEIVIGECDGHDEFKEEFVVNMYQILQELVDVKKRL
jgi:hypothetical protein